MYAGPARWGSWLLLAILLSSGLRAEVKVSGRAVDENGAAVAGAHVELRGAGFAASAVTDLSGKFLLELKAPGDYVLSAECRGYFVLTGKSVLLNEGANQLTVTLNHIRERTESVDVVAVPTPIDRTEPAEQQKLDNVEILQVPYPAPHDFRSALPLFQGIVQDNAGRLHFSGGSTNQAAVSLDGFNIADPATGTVEARLSIDAVRSMDLESSRFSAAKGKGSTASLDLKSGMGDDRLRFSGTNFFPGITTQRGIFVNKWTPRITLSGPLAPGRAWFYNAFDAFYDVDVVRELPPGQDRSRGLTTGNLTRFQVNVTPSQILTGSFLVNYDDSNRAGLSFLDPAETTTDRRRKFFMSTLRHQAYFHGGGLLEIGFADSRSMRRDSPYGNSVYEISPQGRRGNYFVDLMRRTDRQQLITQLYLPQVQASGAHQFLAGLDVERLGFRQAASRHCYQVLRLDGTISREVAFYGGGRLRGTDVAPAAYVQDRWAVRDGVILEAGLRNGWDRITRRIHFGPRFSAALATGWMRGVKLSAGWGVFHDAFALGTLSAGQDQVSVARFFAPDGMPAPQPIETQFRAPDRGLRLPRADVLSLTVERKLLFDFFGKASYTRRVGREGLTFTGELDRAAAPAKMVYTLRNSRNDRYDAVDLGLRRTFGGQFEWFGGYTWSRARSDAVVDYSLEDPFFAAQGPGPFAWDTPHRFLTWGWAPVPVGYLPRLLRRLANDTSASYLMEARTGFPFSVVNEEGFLVGKPNGVRFPAYFSLNLHLERKFRVLNSLWAWRFGSNNITNNGNPNVVNNNINSPEFLAYGRGQPRAFSVRLRFLGRR